jgi:four helix bundle protein
MGDLKERTKSFALAIIHLYAVLPQRSEARVIGQQVLRSGTSVGAHYREATRARSSAEYISKLEVGLQELEESIYWLELLRDTNFTETAELDPLFKEASELIAIFVTCVKKARQK